MSVSSVLGVDLSSFAIDLVLLDEEAGGCVEWLHLDLVGGSSFDRCRQVPAVMPGPSWYDDHGVYLAAIEKPTAASFKSAGAQFPVFGAVAVLLPADLLVWSFTPAEWKLTLGVPLQDKPTHADIAAIVGDAADAWPQDALDACGVAYAAREQNARAIEVALRGGRPR